MPRPRFGVLATADPCDVLVGAARKHLVTVNPALSADPPRLKPGKLHIPSMQDVRAVHAVVTPAFGTFVQLAATVGARRGTLVLRWGDVDLDGPSITFTRSLADSGNGTVEKGTKADRPYTVTLGSGTVAVIAAHRQRGIEQALAVGAAFGPESFVFSDDGGLSSWSLSWPSHAWARGCAKAGVKPTRLHDLRHTAASQMLMSGIEAIGIPARRLDDPPPALSEFFANRPTSPRGLISEELLRRADDFEHCNSVVRGLRRFAGVKAVATTYEGPPQVSSAKLCDYCLTEDTSHAGYPKARVFASALGILRPDWRYLGAQLQRGLRMSLPFDVQANGFGVKYSADIPVLGRNGAVRLVRTVWIAEPAEAGGTSKPPRLVTAYIRDSREGPIAAAEHVAPPVLAPHEDGDWARLNALAHAHATGEVASEPAALQLGRGLRRPHAVAVIIDPSPFADWLLAKSFAEQRDVGIVVSMDSAPARVARPYAHAYRDALVWNGISAWVLGVANADADT